jgi:predicted PurR-regulated permease PerM
MAEFAFWILLTIAVWTGVVLHFPSMFAFVGLLLGIAAFACAVRAWNRSPGGREQ